MSINRLSSASQSGLHAATARLEANAHNTANVETEGFDPQRVEQQEGSDGGVRVTLSQPDLPNPTYERGGAPREASNADVPRGVINRRLAVNAFRANLLAMRTADEVVGALLNDEG